ncbi:ComF family protein [Pedobacter sp. AW31-3R]|uniref:ComF family protein n=1 Tax=Pedobacter sp. AW31-3R TaxID=3445781 RepID=UPI003F9F245B
MHIIGRLAKDFLGLLYPDLCNGCGTLLFQGEKQICTKCLYDLPFTGFETYAANRVHQLFWGRLSCDQAMAMLYFRKGSRVQQLIHQLKYNDQTSLGIALGSMLGYKLLTSPAYCTVDFIIPIPLHPSRQRSRGYNQSEYFARGISMAMGIPVSNTQLIRQKETSSQTKKTRYQRFENMQYVFKVVHPESLKDKHVLLVDDVITTGSTFESAGQLLLNCGISKLSIAAIAFAE